MTAYALAHLYPQAMHPEIIEYIERIQATLDPFGGRFLVHGAPPDVREGSWSGDLVMLSFPDMAKAQAWYASPAYQEIVPLRARHIPGDLILIDGVGPDYDPSAKAAKLRAAAGL
jgi:uncharacterized protein (DUF1330 family)